MGALGGSIDRQLRLDELQSLSVPSTFEVSGADRDATGRIVTWQAGSGKVLEWNRRSWTTVCRGVAGRVLAAAIVDTSSTIEIVDAKGPRVLRQRRGKPCVVITSLPRTEAIAAVRWHNEWIVATIDQRGDRQLRSITGNGTVHSFLDGSGTIPLRNAHLTPGTQGIIVAADSWPFEHELIGPSVVDPKHGTPFVREQWLVVDGDTLEAPHTTALAIHELDDGYIQVVADLRSDMRVLTLLDSALRPVKARALDAPLGVLATYPATQTLLAVRRTRGLEIVVYRWRWLNSGNGRDSL